MKRFFRVLSILCLLSFLFFGFASCSAASDTAANESAAREKTEDETTASVPEEQPIHPSFDLTEIDLDEITRELPERIRENILSRPQFFLQLIEYALYLPDWALRLVDKDHSLPQDYNPTDLIYLKDYPLTLNRETLQLSRSCMPDLLAMTEAARAEGVELVYSSTHRPYDYQKMLYERYVAQYGQKEADRFSARPGTSQHQLGTVIDFGSITPEFGDTAPGKWLFRHAWEYGFSLSYPEDMEDVTGYMYEIWHYRYITRTGTLLEREFFGSIQQYLAEFMNENEDYFREHFLY